MSKILIKQYRPDTTTAKNRARDTYQYVDGEYLRDRESPSFEKLQNGERMSRKERKFLMRKLWIERKRMKQAHASKNDPQTLRKVIVRQAVNQYKTQ